MKNGYVKIFFFGIQYVFVMYVGVVVVFLIVGVVLGLNVKQLIYFVLIDIFMCGVVMLF